ncbi:MAG: aminopeptidase [Bacteroidetes bacterium MED-G17]|nr:MAG: aminopeptidase [Bacteroidetes bacterium TMED39]PDH52150.1 MAG: aminopeptidase [Bacteroidetes bacterium MED-G17]|tara:strand:- start:6839 stop:8041 length:1203 start_codon:yes stop_codon:yes gene_type:complete
MRNLIVVCTVLFFGLVGFQKSLLASDTLKNCKNGHYFFKTLHAADALEVQNQNRTSTCWSFSALSFFESEVMRLGKGEHKLSEMFVVRNAYIEKAKQYVRYHGKINFAEGGAFHDIPLVIKNYGMVPESVYGGLEYGLDNHNHGEMVAALSGFLKGIIANKQGQLTSSWLKAFEGILDAYLGEVPKEFSYKGAVYSPKTFASSLGLNMNDYVALSSFTHHPFYSHFVMEVPDNWAQKTVFNLPLNEFMAVMKGVISKGYTFAWGADVSEKGFAYRYGLAIVPTDESKLGMRGQDKNGFRSAGAERMGNQLLYPGAEMKIDQAIRQKAFDNYATTDDHGMHITGMVVDQNGIPYFAVKNSWGKSNYCEGFLYASMPYVAYKTINILVHKNALPKKLVKTIY